MFIFFDSFVKSRILTAKYKSSPILWNWQGAQILSNDSYLSYFEAAKDDEQRSSWTFYKAGIFCFWRYHTWQVCGFGHTRAFFFIFL